MRETQAYSSKEEKREKGEEEGQSIGGSGGEGERKFDRVEREGKKEQKRGKERKRERKEGLDKEREREIRSWHPTKWTKKIRCKQLFCVMCSTSVLLH